MRLIDAETVCNRCKESGAICTGRDCEIPTTPTIGAVPVVRCRECKYYKDLGTYYRLMDCTHRDGLTNPYEDDFCSYGEQKD